MKDRPEEVLITTQELTIHDIDDVIQKKIKLRLSDEVKTSITKCRHYLDQKIENGDDIFYGINTGFGSLCNTIISNDNLSQLQENLVKSHACGMGDEVPDEIVKIMLLLKIQGLSYGKSGVALATVQRLVDFYNYDVLPIVFEEGSLGASGDLAPLAHLSLPLLGLGYVKYKGERKKAIDVLKLYDWEPIQLKSKEGLALLNGTQFMSAYGVWILLKADRLNNWADLIGALSLEAYDGNVASFSEEIHAIRKHIGQVQTATNFRKLLTGSQLADQPKINVQDPYSFRCIPQVHGASKDTFEFVSRTFNTEINSVTDNPTIFPEKDLILSAGNFHGQPLSIGLDYLAISLAELGSISERRVYKLVSGTRNLPSFLVAKSGLNSGFMIAQYTCASLVSKNKQMCMPNSVDSVDSSQGQEDHVSMGANAAVKCLKVAKNLEKIMAIELMTACQAIEFRSVEKTSPILQLLFNAFRKEVAFIAEDSLMHDPMICALEFIKNEDLSSYLGEHL